MSARSFGKQTFSPKVASLPWLEGKYSLEQRTQEGKSEPKIKRGQVSAHFDQLCQKGNKPLEFSVTLFNKSLFCLSCFELASVPCNQDLKCTPPTLSRDQRGGTQRFPPARESGVWSQTEGHREQVCPEIPSSCYILSKFLLFGGERHPQMIHVRINEIFEPLLNHHM